MTLTLMTIVTVILLFSSSYPQAGCNLLVGRFSSVVECEVKRIGKLTMVPVQTKGYAVAQLLEALSYKPEVRGSLELCFDIILPAAFWPWG